MIEIEFGSFGILLGACSSSVGHRSLARQSIGGSLQHPDLKVNPTINRDVHPGARLAQAAADRSPVVALAVRENSRRLVLRELIFLLLAVALRENKEELEIE